MRKGIIVDVTAADRARLRAVVSNRNSPQKHVWRAKIILLTADGLGTNAIMRGAGRAKSVVWRWQERFMREGVDGLLRDKTHPPARPLDPAVHRAGRPGGDDLGCRGHRPARRAMRFRHYGAAMRAVCRAVAIHDPGPAPRLSYRRAQGHRCRRAPHGLFDKTLSNTEEVSFFLDRRSRRGVFGCSSVSRKGG
jgi:hypothetical protein